MKPQPFTSARVVRCGIAPEGSHASGPWLRPPATSRARLVGRAPGLEARASAAPASNHARLPAGMSVVVASARQRPAIERIEAAATRARGDQAASPATTRLHRSAHAAQHQVEVAARAVEESAVDRRFAGERERRIAGAAAVLGAGDRQADAAAFEHREPALDPGNGENGPSVSISATLTLHSPAAASRARRAARG